MAQWLRAPAALPGDPGSIPCTYMEVTTVCHSSSRGSGTLAETYVQAKNKNKQTNKQNPKTVYIKINKSLNKLP